MKTPHPYIVLTPGMRTNPVPKHVVVSVEEWKDITLGNRDSYVSMAEFDTYTGAAAERDRRNHRPGVSITKPKPPQPLSEVLQEHAA